jgi:glutathione S-transferase
MRHGGIALCESRAICYYIDHAFAGLPLVPREPVAAARVEQWLSLVNTAVDPLLLRTYLRAYIFPNTADGSPERPTIEAALPKMREQFQMLDAAVATTGYLAGDSFTLADMNLLPILYYMKKMPESRAMLAQATRLTAYFERHFARPSVRGSIPESLPPPFVRVFEAAEAA